MTLARTVPFPQPDGPAVVVIATRLSRVAEVAARRMHLSAIGPSCPQTPHRMGTRQIPAYAGIVDLLPYGVPASMLAHPPVLHPHAQHLVSELPIGWPGVLL